MAVFFFLPPPTPVIAKALDSKFNGFIDAFFRGERPRISQHSSLGKKTVCSKSEGNSNLQATMAEI